MKRIFDAIATGSLFATLALAQPHYQITDLGTLGGAGTNSTATDINNFGLVTGSSNLVANGPQHAFVWYGFGALKDLGTLGGPACSNCNSDADGPNLLGQVAIGSDTSVSNGPTGEDFCGFGSHRQCRGAIWTTAGMQVLPNLPGGNNANAFDLNDNGQVIGWAETGTGDATCAPGTPFQNNQFQAVVWQNGQIRELAPLPGDTVGFAFGINNLGQAVGGSGLCSNTSLPPNNPSAAHAVLWQSDGTPTDLSNLGGTFNLASAINNLGVVVGAASSPLDGVIHAFRWTQQTGMQDYGAFPGAIITVAPCCRTINDSGQIVGFAIDGTTFNSTALVWQGAVPVDMNTLIPPNSGWFLQAAQSINNDGKIIGYGTINGETHAFLATPR